MFYFFPLKKKNLPVPNTLIYARLRLIYLTLGLWSLDYLQTDVCLTIVLSVGPHVACEVQVEALVVLRRNVKQCPARAEKR